MKFDISVLKSEEQAIFQLRSLYRKYGYSQYKMSKFEEYDLYIRNKDFLVSDNIITFNDTDGRLLALKPDVTLSIIKNGGDFSGSVKKVYYDENVYRVSKGSQSFKEIMQVGLECIGDVDGSDLCEVVMLAAESLKSISRDYILDISHMGIVAEVIDEIGVSGEAKKEILKCIAEKNLHGISKVCAEEGVDEVLCSKLIKIVSCCGKADTALIELEAIVTGEEGKAAIAQLKNIFDVLEKGGYSAQIDFSVIHDINYYNGIVFKGFIKGIPDGILSGGQYDMLMKKMKKKAGAVGFAVYLDMLERLTDDDITADEVVSLAENVKTNEKDNFLNVALPKGRLGQKVYDLFAKAGFECPEILEDSRKLIFENKELGVRYFWVKPSDVAIYVERGAADIGVAGKDILLEYEPDIYELLDLNMGKCRMAVAAKSDFCDNTQKTLRVATKFSNIAKRFYSSKGREIDIIHLNGSIEIAPLLDLSDVIVDIVETGTTLKENHLEVIDEIVPISARLISNKVSYKFKSEQIDRIVKSLGGKEND